MKHYTFIDYGTQAYMLLIAVLILIFHGAAVPNWPIGSAMHVRGRTLVVVGKRDDNADQPPVLIVEQV